MTLARVSIQRGFVPLTVNYTRRKNLIASQSDRFKVRRSANKFEMFVSVSIPEQDAGQAQYDNGSGYRAIQNPGGS